MITLLRNVSLYSPQKLGLKDVLVTANKVAAINNANSSDLSGLPTNWPIEVIDCKGNRLIPGLIDSHAHITGGGGEAGFATQVPPVPVSEFSQAGVTTVVGLLGTDDTTRSTENLLARVYALREEGLSAYCWTGGYHLPLTTLTENAKRDMVFLEPVIGIGEFAISDHRSSQPTFEEIIRLASDAHVAGLITGKAGVLHFHLGDGERGLELINRAITETELPARVFNPTHVNRNTKLFNESCELIKKGCYIDITAFPKGTAAPGLEAFDAINLTISRNLPLDKITVSSDGGGCLPCFNQLGELQHMDFGKAETLLETLQDLLASGTTLETVLPMFTQNVATLLKFNRKGQIATGFDADLLLLNEANQITDVMAMGKWHRRDGQLVMKGMFE